MIPATINCCYAFCLPVGTPCNAMVLTAGKIKTSFMVIWLFISWLQPKQETHILLFVLITDESGISDEHFHSSHRLFDHGQYRRFGLPLERLSRLDHHDCLYNNRIDGRQQCTVFSNESEASLDLRSIQRPFLTSL